MRTILHDVRFGLRLLKRDPGFTAVAVVTLAIGIAVNTTVFSWIDGLLLRPFPGAANAQELAAFEMVTDGAPNGGNQLSYLDYRDYSANLQSLSGLALHREEVFTLGHTGDAQAVWGELVSGNYFDVLGVTPAMGRFFTLQEGGDELGVHSVAVISYRLWRDRFHADARVLGRTVRINQREMTVIGVTPPDFRGTMPGLVFDLWVPATMGREVGMLGESAFRSRGARSFYGLARLRQGTSIKEATAEAAAIARNLGVAFPKTNERVSAAVVPVWQFHSAAPDLLLKHLRILMAVAILFLLIVCANVGNLLLSRAVARRREFGVRLALGAGGFRLTRQLLTETLLLALGGAVAGLALAPWIADLLPALVPRINAPVAFGFNLSARVLAFTVLAALIAAILAGFLSALLWHRSNMNEWLKEGGRGGSDGLPSNRTRGLLVVAEVALACVALIGAGIFVRSFQNARSIHPGFEKQNVLLARFYMAGSGYSGEDLQQFCMRLRERLRERLRSVPGVAAVSYADYAPLGSSAGPYETMDVEGYVPNRHESMDVNRYAIAPGYFRALRTSLLEGRDFTDSDDADSAPVMIVNEQFVRRYFGGSLAIGRKVRLGRRVATVVGLVRDSKYFDVTETPRPHFFTPMRQRTRLDQQVYFFVRAVGDPLSLTARFRREIAAVDPKAAAGDMMPLEEWTNVTLLPQRVTASMAGALGLISLVLAALGLYSVMAYAVSQRTREIGIRMALGARPRNVLADILLRGLKLTAGGLLAGIAAALVVMRLAGTVLVDVSSTDPPVYVGAAVFLAGIGLLASYLPARRATRINPISALRQE